MQPNNTVLEPRLPSHDATETVKQGVAPGNMVRRHDLDALRAIAMLMGIVLHGAIAYIPMIDDGWPVHDANRHQSLGVLMAVVHGFRMPLFFLISGFFTAMLWRKRGLNALIKHRFKRIFLPLLIGLFTIVPAVWVVSIGTGIRSAFLNAGAPENIWKAARTQDLAVIDQQLADGSDVDGLEPETGLTPLSIAAQRAAPDLVKHLIENNATVNARNRDGSTALHWAALFGRAHVASILLENGADSGARNRLGETPAQMIGVNGMRLSICAHFNKVELDSLSKRRDIADRLSATTVKATTLDAVPPVNAPTTDAVPTDQSSNAELANADEGVAQDRANDVAQTAVLLLLILFPLFHHLWFLWFLCWLVAAFAIYAILVDRSGVGLPKSLVLTPLRYVWLIPLTILPQSMMGLMYSNFGPDTSTGLLPMPQILFYYALFFFFGALYFDSDDVLGRLGRWWRVTLPVALLIVFPLGYEFTSGELGFTGASFLDSGWCRPLAIALQVIYAWMMSFGLMGMFRSLSSTENKWMRYISDSAYWLYLAHLPLIMVFQSIVQGWQMPAIVKLAVVCAVTTLLLLASYQTLIRYTPIGTLLNGPRTRRINPPVETSLAV